MKAPLYSEPTFEQGEALVCRAALPYTQGINPLRLSCIVAFNTRQNKWFQYWLV